MKLSKAIVQGSTMVRPKAGGQFFSKTQEGCALGMAAFARGCSFGPVKCSTPSEKRTFGVEKIWGEWVLCEVARPCDCWRLRVPREMRIKDIIAHLFDHHVMKKRNWTLEMLVAWVETVEPEEVLSPPATLRPYLMIEELRGVFRTGHRDEDWEARVKAFLDLAEGRIASENRAASSLQLARYRSRPKSARRPQHEYSAERLQFEQPAPDGEAHFSQTTREMGHPATSSPLTQAEEPPKAAAAAAPTKQKR